MRALAFALVSLLAVWGLAVPSATAAESGGVTLTVEYGGETYGGDTVVAPGSSYTARLQYSVPNLTPGGSVVIGVPDGITVPEAGLVVPSGNTIVESLALNAEGDVVMAFTDPLDNTIDQGIVAFDFVFDEPESGTGLREVTWTVGDQQVTVVNIIVRDSDDALRPMIPDSVNKSAIGHHLNSKISRDEDGTVAVDPSVTSVEIPYTVRIDSQSARDGVQLVDTLSDYLEHDLESFSAALTTWDENGFNRTVTDFDLGAPTIAGNAVTFPNVDIPAQSQLEISYHAHVKADKVDAIEAELQESADAVDPVSGGSYSIKFENDLDLSGATSGATVTMSGSIAAEPAPNVGAAFRKTSDLASPTQIRTDDAGNLLEPVPVTYSLKFNLTQFAEFADTRHELTKNVVVTDTLRDSARWDTTTELESSVDLDPATDQCLAADDFSADECVYQYDYVDAGQTLMINMGRDTMVNTTVKARAEWVSMEGLPVTEEPSWAPQIAAQYTAVNDAYFDYSDNTSSRRSRVSDTLTEPKAPGSVIDDPSEFSKSTEGEVVLVPGESAQIRYDFVIANGAVEDLRSTRLIDEVDTVVFDLSDLDAIHASIEGSYAYADGLSSSDFVVERNEDDLVITLSDTFGADLPSWVDVDGELTDHLTVSVVLPTHPINGKQTLEITNNARVESDGLESYEWVSEASGQATTYGDELEVEKILYGGDGEWTGSMRAELAADGSLVDDTFIYRVSLIPHGNYSGVAIIPLEDVLPEGMRFNGFVSDADLESGTVLPGDSVDMGGNVTATWNEQDRTVEIEQAPGTTLPQGAKVSANFQVSITEFTEDLPVVNRIGSASATITPSDGYPLSVAKVDTERPSLLITDRDARFTVTGPDGETITDAAYVVDGQLAVESSDGGDSAIVIPEDPQAADGVPAGKYTITETVPPAGYELSQDPVIATISPEGTSNPVTLFNDPEALMAIGDYTWIDENADGIQDADEPALSGVTVELLDGVTGEVLNTTTTDSNGRYLFDLLPAGDYQVRFTLTDEQQAVYMFTDVNIGQSDEDDSDAVRATGLTEVFTLDPEQSALVANDNYPHADVKALLGVDPTWDAGVVALPPSVSVGDLVWLDITRDGRQDNDEPGLSDVVMVLTGPEGESVTDVTGAPVEPVSTDGDGRYLFTGLPVLEEGQQYTVSIDPAASADALEAYEPTVPAVGDREGDSSEWTASSLSLVEDGAQDLTLDFGFVRANDQSPGEEPPGETPPGAEEPESPTIPTPSPSVDPAPGEPSGDASPDQGDVTPADQEGNSLPVTGAQVTQLMVIVVLLLAAGGVLIVLRRRHNS